MASYSRGMADGYSDDSTLSSYRQPSKISCRTIREGIVQVIIGKHSSERYMKAVCGSNEGCTAKLELKDTKSVNTEEIFFTDVNYVSFRDERRKKIITIGLERSSNNISFCAGSHSSTIKWYTYCGLLLTIPQYAIPEIPKENVALQQGIKQMDDSTKFNATNKWVVYILDEGVGHTIGLTGLCIVVLSTVKSTFNVYSFYTKKHLLTWYRDDMRVSGCIDSLVFVEINKTCSGGPGLLWMQHPTPQSMTLQEQLNDFLHACPEDQRANSPVNHVAIGSPMHSAYIRNDFSQQPAYVSLGANIATSQSHTSLSSENSQCSSGYYSDSSCGGSSVNMTQLPLPKYTCKNLTGKLRKEKHSGITDTSLIKPPVMCSSPVQVMSSSTINNDRCTPSSIKSLENGPTQKDISLSAVSHQYQAHTLPSESSFTSEKLSMIPKLSGYESTSSHCVTYGCQSPATVVHPTSLQDPNKMSLQYCCSSSLNEMTGTASKHQMEKIAFQKCSVITKENLNINMIIPYLIAQGLLTEEDHEILLSFHFTDVKKIHYLLKELPRKGKGFFDKFSYCLHQTKRGTGHGDIVKALSTTYREIRESSNRVGTLMMPHAADY